MDTTERDRIIAGLLAEGRSLSEVQKILETEYEIKITYMDLRLIAADLEVNWEKQDAAKAEETPEVPDLSDVPAAGGGETVINLSKIVRPGAVLSGDVVFKSGAKAEWYIDQMGRLGLSQADGAEKPTEDDLVEFQEKLQQELQGRM